MREEIEELAKSKANEILEEVKATIDEILNESKKEAEKIKQSFVDEARSQAKEENIREVSRKKQSIKMDYLQSRESIIDEIQVAAIEELEKFTSSKDYVPFLEKLVESSALSIGGGSLKIVLRKADKSHLSSDTLGKIGKSVTKEIGVETTLSITDQELNTSGGLQVVRFDDKLFVDNTFESRLERTNEETRVELLKLFS